MKLEKALDQSGKRKKPTSISVQSPNGKMSISGEGVVIERKICGSGNLIINGMMKGNVDLVLKLIEIKTRYWSCRHLN